MTSFDLYPTLDGTRVSKIYNSVSIADFYYHLEDNNEENKLKPIIVDAPNHFSLLDEKAIWDKDKHDICFRKKITLTNIQFLFGPEGIACSDSDIGIGLLWYSQPSKQRGSKILGDFTRKDTNKEFICEYESEISQLRGIVNFSFILFVKKAGHPTPEELFLANTPGMILGEIENFSLFIDGGSSQFPIYEFEDPEAPLWMVEFNWEDATSDSFISTVKLKLNAYRKQEFEEAKLSTSLMNEIMSSVLLQFFLRIKDETELDAIIKGKNLEPYSVGSVAHYYIKNLNLNLDDVVDLSEKIRNLVTN